MKIQVGKRHESEPSHDLAERILAEEGAGVLNFMLDGLEALRAANWQLRLNDAQQRRVDDLLLESNSHRVFVAECLVKDSAAPGLTKAEVYAPTHVHVSPLLVTSYPPSFMTLPNYPAGDETDRRRDRPKT